MEIGNIILSIVIGIAIGFGMIMIYAWFLYRDLKSRVDEMIAEVIEQHEANLIGLDVELENGIYFCYDSKDKTFICQGSTVGEIAVAFRARYPTKTAYLAGGEPEVVEQFKKELLKLATNETSDSQ